MKVYVVFVQNKVYQEIGNVYTNLEDAQKEVDEFNLKFPLSFSMHTGAVIIDRDLTTKELNEEEDE